MFKRKFSEEKIKIHLINQLNKLETKNSSDEKFKYSQKDLDNLVKRLEKELQNLTKISKEPSVCIKNSNKEDINSKETDLDTLIKAAEEYLNKPITLYLHYRKGIKTFTVQE